MVIHLKTGCSPSQTQCFVHKYVSYPLDHYYTHHQSYYIGRASMKCRIPQRLPNSQRTPRSPPRTHDLNLPDNAKSYPQCPRSGGGRNREETSRLIRPEKLEKTGGSYTKKMSSPVRKIHAQNESISSTNRSRRPIITIPAAMDTVSAGEDIEHEISNCTKFGVSSESLNSDIDDIRAMDLIIGWQEKVFHYEKLKNGLKDLQVELMTVYSNLREHHEKITALGQSADLPPAEELQIMNVAKLTPEELLQLCVGTNHTGLNSSKWSHTVDMAKLYQMPVSVVAAGEQTLTKRKEIIDWFDHLAKNKGQISMKALGMRLKEFASENETLSNSLQNAKTEFYKNLNEVIEYLRKGMSETIALQLRMEEMTLEISQLNDQNTELKKQIDNVEHCRSQNNKARVEELEKELKEEKSKRIFTRERLSRAEGQVKTQTERVSQVEAALQQAQNKTYSLERTVQELREQNQHLQENFDKELTKLTASIKDNTTRLEQIAEAREKLQTEKEDLERHLKELSEHYNESLSTVKHEMNVNVAKLLEFEKNYNQLREERDKLEGKLKDIQKELDTTRDELATVNKDNDDYKERSVKQSEEIKMVENSYKKTEELQNILRQQLQNKEDYIAELEDKQKLYEEQIQESEDKMKSYEQHLNSLKEHIIQLQKDLGQFKNLDELHDMINKQRAELHEVTRQNCELVETLQKKDLDIQQIQQNIAEMQQGLEERERVIKVLSNKDEEQKNIIKLLKNNLEFRSKADSDINHQINEKNTEIESLVNNIETKRLQISQLEKIILTLEDQTRKASVQRRKDQERISSLENRISEYEKEQTRKKHEIESSAEDIDTLMKLIEDEIETPLTPNEQEYAVTKNMTKERIKRDSLAKLECNTSYSMTDYEAKPAKIVMDNFLEKTYLSNNNNEENKKFDGLNRKKGITNIDTQIYAIRTPTESYRASFSNPKEISRNTHFFNNQFCSDKKAKMLRLAGHRL